MSARPARPFGLVPVLVFAVLMLTAAPAVALQTIPSSRFTSAEGCGCHPGMYDSWGRSMHAQALSDPLYRLKLDEATKATKGAVTQFCEGCHGAIAVMSGELGPSTPISKLRGVSAQAITCDLCHQVSGSRGRIGNLSLVWTPDGTKRAGIRDAKSPEHKSAYSKFHTTAEFCGSCHDVYHPTNGLRLESTYSEWKAGPYAREGVVCQDCHMTPGPGVTKPNPGRAAVFGPDRDHVYTMTWAGGNTALGDRELAEERLKAAAEVTVTAPEIVPKGGTVRFTTTITNVGAGHYLPTGLTEVRQMWLEVTGTDRNGQKVLRERHDFGTVLKDAKGRYPAEVWNATGIQSDDRIPPKKSVSHTWESPMPANGPLTLTAVLYYRSVPEEMAKAARVDVERTLMARSTDLVYDSEAQRESSMDEANREALRLASGEAPGFRYGVFVALALLALLTVLGVGIWRAVRA